MLAQKPPMGWNTWNTFGTNINEQLIIETTDAIVEKGYRDAGYEYVVIDDCWALKSRDENGYLVPDPEKFPHGMKYLADYVHSKGLKFGMYSCAGVRTCGNFPSSYGYEFKDAKTFAEWGVDFLKYDFCNFPHSANCKNAYLTMSNALKASGREILFSMCNWGFENTWYWARSVGGHIYRSTADIFDSYASTKKIATSQMPNLHASTPGCFNDLDMLTIGMYNQGNTGLGTGSENGCLVCSDYTTNNIDYETQFALWCMFSSPLMIGGDIRNMNDFSHKLLTNKELIAINQDEEARQPYLVNRDIPRLDEKNTDDYNAFIDTLSDNGFYTFLKLLSNNEYALLLWNVTDQKGYATAIYQDMGFPVSSNMKLEFKEILGDSKVDYYDDFLYTELEAHQCKLLKFTVKEK